MTIIEEKYVLIKDCQSLLEIIEGAEEDIAHAKMEIEGGSEYTHDWKISLGKLEKNRDKWIVEFNNKLELLKM